MMDLIEERKIFERIADCLTGWEEGLFECIRADPPDRCQVAYIICEGHCETRHNG